MKRRTFIKNAGLAAAIAGSAAFPNFLRGAEAAKAARKPNILVVMVDQLRFPQGSFSQGLLDQAAPNMAALRQQSVSFDSHYAAATACSPSRSTLATGLYTHQNGMFLTNAQGLAGQPSTPDLNPGFPTWGSILSGSGFGYKTYWWGNAGTFRQMTRQPAITRNTVLRETFPVLHRMVDPGKGWSRTRSSHKFIRHG